MIVSGSAVVKNSDPERDEDYYVGERRPKIV